MFKKSVLTIFLLLVCSLIYAASMSLKAEGNPTSVTLTWEHISGSYYYDIYKDDAFVVRLKATDLLECEYKIGKLMSNSNFTFKIAARTMDNKTLAAGIAHATTLSWDGIYKWVNETEHTNNGMLEELTLRAETHVDSEYGQYYAIYYVSPSGEEVKIFPLFDFSDQSAYEWHKYKDDTVAGISYRTNAELFNTSPFKPGKWKVYSIVIDSNGATAYIQTSAIGMEFLTTTVFEFYEDESGNMFLSLDTKGEQKIVDNYLLKNPNPGSGDAFILNKIS